MKGVAKFQDSGSIGAGIMEGVGSFVFAFIKLGKEFSLKQDLALAIVQAPYKAGTEFVGGASFGDAVVAGDLKITGPFVERLFKMGLVKTLFQKLAVPMVIKYGSKNVTADQLSKWLGKGVQKVGVEKYGKHWLRDGSTPGEAQPEPAVKKSPLIDQATLTNRMLLNLSFVNMVNGIGRGW